MADCSRVDYKPSSSSAQPSAAACLHACSAAGAASCAAWNWDSASGSCALLPSAGRMVFAAGVSCGVAGSWDSSDGTALSLAMHPTDAKSAGGPAWGDVALRPVGGTGSGATLSFAVADDPALLFAAFSSGGGAFAPGTNGGVTGGSFSGVAAAHGAVSVTSGDVAPGDTVSVSIVLSWYFPERDYYGRTVGQFYSTLFTSAADVVRAYDATHIAEVATTAAAHTSVWASAETTMPAWLSDHMVNQVRVRGGRGGPRR